MPSYKMMVIRLDLKIICVTSITLKTLYYTLGALYLHKSVQRISSGRATTQR